jgi:hypothetical protein
MPKRILTFVSGISGVIIAPGGDSKTDVVGLIDAATSHSVLLDPNFKGITSRIVFGNAPMTGFDFSAMSQKPFSFEFSDFAGTKYGPYPFQTPFGTMNQTDQDMSSKFHCPKGEMITGFTMEVSVGETIRSVQFTNFSSGSAPVSASTQTSTTTSTTTTTSKTSNPLDRVTWTTMIGSIVVIGATLVLIWWLSNISASRTSAHASEKHNGKGPRDTASGQASGKSFEHQISSPRDMSTGVASGR